mgnify:CR=1 FL=1
MRLQKLMAEAGIASRRKCEELIAQGKVFVNGNAAGVGCVVDPERDVVEYNGERVRPAQRRVVLAFYKPRGVMCTVSDPEGRETVMDYFRQYPLRLYPVGRLDYDSEGLLLMTNDGELAYRLTHPKFIVEKTYHAVCAGCLAAEEAAQLERGVALEDGPTAPARVEHIRRLQNGNTVLELTIHEGKNRQVRRMLSAVGHETLLLRRIREGAVSLGALRPGQWREIAGEELAALEGERGEKKQNNEK